MSLVNRLSVCPTLIRTFFQKDEHHTIANFMKEFPTPEIYVYTWKDATLREISYSIIRSAKLDHVKTMSFIMIYPNMEDGGWGMKPLAIVDLTSTEISTNTLESYGYMPGFMLDVLYTK